MKLGLVQTIKGAEWRSAHMLLRLSIDASCMAFPARLRATGLGSGVCYKTLQEELKEYATAQRQKHDQEHDYSAPKLLLEQLHSSVKQEDEEQNLFSNIGNALFKGITAGVTAGVAVVRRIVFS